MFHREVRFQGKGGRLSHLADLAPRTFESDRFLVGDHPKTLSYQVGVNQAVEVAKVLQKMVVSGKPDGADVAHLSSPAVVLLQPLPEVVEGVMCP